MASAIFSNNWDWLETLKGIALRHEKRRSWMLLLWWFSGHAHRCWSDKHKTYLQGNPFTWQARYWLKADPGAAITARNTAAAAAVANSGVGQVVPKCGKTLLSACRNSLQAPTETALYSASTGSRSHNSCSTAATEDCYAKKCPGSDHGLASQLTDRQTDLLQKNSTTQ